MLSARDRRGYQLIAVAGIVIFALFATRIAISGRRSPGPDNCIGDPVASTVMVFDRSDGVSAQTLDEMKARAAAYIQDSVKINERVSIFAIDDSSIVALRPIISLCRPRLSGSEITANVRLLKRQYSQRFEQPIDSALTTIVGTGPRSPIAETLIDLSLSRFLNAPKNSLLIFSDLLENTDRFSLYRCPSPAWAIQNFKASRGGARERPAFRNTRVYLNIIPRLGYSPSVWQCRDAFWPWFFGDDSGPNAGVSTAYLPGGATPHPKS